MLEIKPIALIFLVLICAFFSFSPSLNNGFTNWDDQFYVIDNPDVKDLSLKGLNEIFTTFHRGLYKPFVILSFAVEYHFFKLDPSAYHKTNLILHLINCILVFVFISILCANSWVAFISALLFGIHPLHVESVAWITERKDMLYAFFFLGSLISYLNFRRGQGMKYYYFSLFLFVASLFSKPMGIFLPFMTFACDYLQGKRFDKNNFLQKIPFFIIAAAFVGLTFNATKDYVKYEPYFNALDNVFIGCYGVVFYIVKFFVPFNLSALYPYPSKVGSYLPAVFLLSPLAVIFFLWGALKTGKYTKDIIFGIVFYLLAVFPGLQFVPSGPAIAADRYAYISSIGIFYIVGAVIFRFYSKKLKNNFLTALVSVFLVFMMAGLMFLTRDRCKIWHDSVTLWSSVIVKFPDAKLPYQNRGAAYLELGDFDNAALDFKRAIYLDPVHAVLYDNLGKAYAGKGDFDNAILDFKRAIYLDPGQSDTYYNLGNAYAGKGDFESAFSCYDRALSIDPGNGNAYYNRAVTYFLNQEYNKAWADMHSAQYHGYEGDPNFLEDLKKVSGRQE